MVTIYHYDFQNVFDGLTQEISEDQGAPISWTFTPVPPIPDGKFAYFVGPSWIIIDERPPLPPEPTPPVVNEAPAVM